MTLTEEQKKEVKHLCRVLGIGKLEAIARVLTPAPTPDRKSFEKIREDIRAAGGDGWDHVDDPMEVLRDLRGEDELPEPMFVMENVKLRDDNARESPAPLDEDSAEPLQIDPEYFM